jgi:hypothetical protein
MPFERYLAIDWSGDKRVLTHNIQVAEYVPATRSVRIVPSPAVLANGRWSRGEVFTQMQRWVAECRTLIGFDFAFAYPFCDCGQYFPGHPESPGGLQQLWQRVDTECQHSGNFYGGQFYLPRQSTFSRFHHYRNPRHPDCRLRFRVTDQRARLAANRRPSSVFECVGQKQVGPGSIAGMRLLLRARDETNAIIWPFDTTEEPQGSTIVEIYPRIFLRRAETLYDDRLPPRTVPECLERYGTRLAEEPQEWTNDKRDAVVSAAGMGWCDQREGPWEAPNDAPACAATHEGWMFGVH